MIWVVARGCGIPHYGQIKSLYLHLNCGFIVPISFLYLEPQMAEKEASRGAA